MSGKLKITVVYHISVSDLVDYEADSLEQAARNLSEWYADGSAVLEEDVAHADNRVVTVETVIGEESSVSKDVILVDPVAVRPR